MATQGILSSLELRVQFCLLVCCTCPSSSTVNKEKNLIDQRASLRVDTRETQQNLLRILYTTEDAAVTIFQSVFVASLRPIEDILGESRVCSLCLRLGVIHPLQDVALHQCLPSSSVCCLPNPGGSLLLCYVVLPSSAWSSPWSLPSPWLPLCAAFGPPIVLHSCYMTGPFPLLFQCVFYDINYLCNFPDFWA